MPRSPKEPNPSHNPSSPGLDVPIAGAEEAARLDTLIGQIRSNLRWRRCLQGLATSSVLILLAALIVIASMANTQFEAGSVAFGRFSVYLVSATLLTFLVIKRCLARWGDHAVAHYLERCSPSLDALLASAVEARDRLRLREYVSRQPTDGNAAGLDSGEATGSNPPIESPQLDASLMARAVATCRDLGLDTTLESQSVKRSGAIVAAILVVGLGLATLGPDALRHGFRVLLVPAVDAAANNPYSVDVTPGTVQLPFGTDVRILANANGFEPDALEIMTRAEGNLEWQRTAMRPASDPGQFEHYLFNLEHSGEYYIRAHGVRSAVFALTVLPRPAIDRIDVVYHFPARTGRPVRTAQNVREIKAVRGTRAELLIHPRRPSASTDPATATDPATDRAVGAVVRGQLVISESGKQALSVDGAVLRGELNLSTSGHFRVEMAVSGGGWMVVTPELPIIALDDGLPSISFLRPGGDAQVTSIEELELELKAGDDIAIRELEMVLSVNGGPDQIIPIAPPREAPDGEPADFTHTHSLFLENLDLAPGDLLAYHARVSDASNDPRRSVSTDMYFLEVRPFDNEFREAGGGGGGRGGGQGGDDNLAAQQRDLVVALFKQVRDRASIEQSVVSERSATLAEAQERIRSRVDAISRRIGARTLVELNEGYKQMAKELPEASAAMIRVQAALSLEDAQTALLPAREALLHLQRAFAAFREVQVARQGRQGNGRARSNASDLANLFKLEMDKFRSQYEQVQRAQPETSPRALDATLDRLRELAQRQQREVERARLREARGLGGAQSQRELITELEETLRQLERLTRKRQEEGLQAAISDLQAAKEAMRKSGQSASSEQSREALDRLRSAKERLNRKRSAHLGDEVGRELKNADRLLEQQAEIERAVRRLDEDSEASGKKRLGEILDRKKSMAAALESMHSRLEQLSGDSGKDQQQAATELADAAAQLRRDDLPSAIEESRERLANGAREPADTRDKEIATGLYNLRNGIAKAARSASNGEPSPALALSEGVRALMRSLAELKTQLRQSAQGGGDIQDQPGTQRGAQRTPTGSSGTNQSGGGARGGRVARGGGTRMAQIREALRSQGFNLTRLRESLLTDGHSAQDISAVIDEVRDLTESDPAWADGARLAIRSDALLRKLQAIESSFRRAGESPADRALAVEEPDLPEPGQEKLAYEYYRQLSEAPR